MALFEMHSYPSRDALGELSGPGGPNVCFLDLITDPERGLDLVAELLSIRQELKIVVLIGTKNPDLILRAMRQGAAEFLVRPFDAAQLDHAIERIAALDPTNSSAAPAGRVVCVFPAKGACGASTVSTALAQSAKRAGFKRILLADLDPLTGMLSFLLKLKGNYSFLDVLTRAQTLDADLWKGLVLNSAGLDVLLAPEGTPESIHELNDAGPILDFARANYEVIIADCGGAYGAWHLSLARRADDILLLTTNELPALQAAQRAIAYLEANEVNKSKIRLVVNRYSKEFGLSREVIETGLHCDIYHLLPSDYESINRALLEGKPVGPGTNFGKSLAQLADRLYGKPNAPAGSAPKKTSTLSSILSLFGKK